MSIAPIAGQPRVLGHQSEFRNQDNPSLSPVPSILAEQQQQTYLSSVWLKYLQSQNTGQRYVRILPKSAGQMEQSEDLELERVAP